MKYNNHCHTNVKSIAALADDGRALELEQERNKINLYEASCISHNDFAECDLNSSLFA